MNSSPSASAALRAPSPSRCKSLAEVAYPVAEELERVREFITERVFREESFAELLSHTGDTVGWDHLVLPEWMERALYQTHGSFESRTRAMSTHLAARGGKLFRATLILTINRALSRIDERAPKLAAGLELIHLATLLHDDVIDRADLRRGSPSMPALFDNAPTVLMGDHVFARAFEMISECGDMRLIASSSRATSAMCRGEIVQLQWIGRHDVPEGAYFRLIEMKTAALMGACAEGAALLAGHDHSRGAWHRFGVTLGLLFQMTDDLLDFIADDSVLGKQTGSDSAAGKYTLPMLILRDRIGGPRALRDFLEAAPSPEAIRAALRDHGVLDESWRRMEDLAQSCREQLDMLAPACADLSALESLHDLVDFVLLRDH